MTGSLTVDLGGTLAAIGFIVAQKGSIGQHHLCSIPTVNVGPHGKLPDMFQYRVQLVGLLLVNGNAFILWAYPKTSRSSPPQIRCTMPT